MQLDRQLPAGPSSDIPWADRGQQADIVALDRKLKDSHKRLTEAVPATGTGLLDLYGIRTSRCRPCPR